MTWRGDKIVDISRDFLNTNGVTQHATASIAPIDESKTIYIPYRQSCKGCLCPLR